MSKPIELPLCFRCQKPRGYRTGTKGLCPSCGASCPACEERPRARYGPYCNPCSNALQQAALCVPGAREKLAERIRRRRVAGPARELLRNARARAKREGLAFSLEVKDIHIPEKCPVLGIPLFVGTRRANLNSPSIDRIVPALGYVVGNVRVISNRANTIRRDATVLELEQVLAYAKSLVAQ